ncbi:MAG: NUDIX hydrolase [Ferruginibacter sp.]|nr:NUDIX hydrolase [Cytophagales bacterium]
MPVYTFCPVCGKELIWGERDGRSNQVCPAGDFIHYNNPVPVVAALVEHEGAVVLARNKTWPPDWFGLITGFLEANETPEEAVLREVEEELNLKGRIAAMIGVYTFFKLNQVYVAYHVVAEGNIALNEELDAYKRVAPADLKPWPFGTGLAVQDWLARRPSPAS